DSRKSFSEVGTPDRCPLGAEMDTSRQVSDGITAKSESLGAAQRQRRSIAAGRLGGASSAVKLLSVRVSESTALATAAHREHSLSADRTPSPASTVPGTI